MISCAGRAGVKGVINFVGGWMGTRCANASLINQALLTRGGRYPGEMLWLYGDGDLSLAKTPPDGQVVDPST